MLLVFRLLDFGNRTGDFAKRTLFNSRNVEQAGSGVKPLECPPLGLAMHQNKPFKPHRHLMVLWLKRVEATLSNDSGAVGVEGWKGKQKVLRNGNGKRVWRQGSLTLERLSQMNCSRLLIGTDGVCNSLKVIIDAGRNGPIGQYGAPACY